MDFDLVMELAADQKIRVLFVDDEENILRALRRMLHGIRSPWNVQFLESGEKALAYLEKSPVDVVVTDMRMPGMNGAELLEKVSRDYPETIRIILSGFSDTTLVSRSIGTSHQFFDKPCDAEGLIASISKSLNLRTLISNHGLHAFLSSLSRLPSSLSTYKKLNAEIAKENAATASIANIIQSDVAFVAKVLKLVNSAYFGLPNHVASCHQAIQLLGLDTIRSIVATSAFFYEFEESPETALTINRLGQRSMEISVLAGEIMSIEGGSAAQQSHASSAGLLLHIGSLLLLANLPELYRSACAICDDDGASIVDAEWTAFKTNHAELGAYLLALWGFPDQIIESVLFHHKPSNHQADAFGPITAVHVAQALVKIPPDEPEADKIIFGNLDMDHLAAVNKTDRISVWWKLYFQLSERRIRP